MMCSETMDTEFWSDDKMQAALDKPRKEGLKKLPPDPRAMPYVRKPAPKSLPKLKG